MEAVSVDSIIFGLKVVAENEFEKELDEETIPVASTLFQTVSRLCFGSLATQAEFSQTEACAAITSILVKNLVKYGDEAFEKAAIVHFFELGLEALTSLISGTNANSNFVGLTKCSTAGTVNLVVNCILACFTASIQIKKQPFLPVIMTPVTERQVPPRKTGDLLPLLERSVRVLENLVLHSSIRVVLRRELNGCELLVRCLSEVGPIKASIAEQSLAALGNLVSADDSTVIDTAESTDAPAVAASIVTESFSFSLITSTSEAESQVKLGSSVSRVVAAGACEAVLKALHQYGSEDVNIADCALFFVQALVVRDTGAVQRFQQYQLSSAGNTTCNESLVSRDIRKNSLMHVKSVITDTTADLNGTLSILCKVVRSHYHTSITVAEAGIGAIGSLVLQSSVLLLHLLSNRGLGLIMSVLDRWGHSNAALCAKCARILTAVVETVRICRREFHRISSSYDVNEVDVGGGGSTAIGTVSRKNSSSSAYTPTQPGGIEHSSTADSSTQQDTLDSLFDCDEDVEAPAAFDIGIPGATPAYVYQVLDRVDVTLLLMDAENGVLEKELCKHQGAAAKRRIGLGTVSTVSTAVSKLKLPRGGARQDSEALPRIVSSAQSFTLLRNALTRSSSIRKTSSSSLGLGSEISLVHGVETEVNDESFGPIFLAALLMLDQHGEYSLEVLHPALKLLLTVCDNGAYPHHWAQVSASNGCAVLVKVLQNPDVLEVRNTEVDSLNINTVITAELGLQILQHLALCSAESREKLCNLNAHSIVVSLLHTHGEHSIFVCNLGAHVFVLLYDTISANEANEGNALACTTILRLLVHYENLNLHFAEVGLHMLETLAQYPPNRRIIGDRKAGAVIVRLVRNYALVERTSHSLQIAKHGLSTICRLAGYEPNQARLAKCGACKLVIELGQHYGRESEAVAAEALSAVCVLAGANRGILGEVEGCRLVVELMAHYTTNDNTLNDGIAHLASLAMHNLCIDYPENKQRFLQLNVAPALKAMLTDRTISHPTRDALKDAINIIRF